MDDKDRGEARKIVVEMMNGTKVRPGGVESLLRLDEMIDMLLSYRAEAKAEALREATDRAVDFCSSWNINSNWLRAAILADEPKKGEYSEDPDTCQCEYHKACRGEKE